MKILIKKASYILVLFFSFMMLPALSTLAEADNKFSVNVETDKESYAKDEEVNYKVTIKNISNEIIKDIAIEDELSSNVMIIRSNGSIEGQKVYWNKDIINPNEEFEISLTVKLESRETVVPPTDNDDNNSSSEKPTTPPSQDNNESEDKPSIESKPNNDNQSGSNSQSSDSANNTNTEIPETGGVNSGVVVITAIIIILIGFCLYKRKGLKSKISIMLTFVLTLSLILNNTLKVKADQLDITESFHQYVKIENEVVSSNFTIKATLEFENKAPEIIAEDVIIQVGEDFDPMSGVKAIDEEDGDITADIKIVENTVNNTTVGEYKVVYEVQDRNGRKAVKIIKVTVNEPIVEVNIDPVIYANDIVLTIGDIFEPLNGVQANDKEDGDITTNIKVIENTVNTNEVGEYKVVYEVEDSQGAKATKEIKVTVKEKGDESPGVINNIPIIFASDITIIVGDDFDPLSGVTATDYEDGDITTNIKVVENTVNISEIGEYKVVYEVQDSQGAKVTKEINVIVKEKESEVVPGTPINLVPVIIADDVTLEVGDEFNPLKGVIATDYEDGDITNRIVVIENTVDTTKIGKYKVVYGVDDSQGAKVTKEITVSVKEKEKIDSDNDGLSDEEEILIGTDPYQPDTDKDGLTDYEEVYIYGTNPLVEELDIDNDGLSNFEEKELGTNLIEIDTDDDGLSDYEEVKIYGTNPLKDDSDSDGIIDGYEMKLGLNPNVYDEKQESYSLTVGNDDCNVVLEVTGSIEEVCNTRIRKVEEDFFNTTSSLIGNTVDIICDNGLPETEFEFSYSYEEVISKGLNEESLSVYWVDEETLTLVKLNTIVDKENNLILSDLNISNDKRAKSTSLSRKNTLYKLIVADSTKVSTNIGNVDIVFVLDNSGSMDENDPEFKRVELSKMLINSLDSDSYRFGVIKFAGSASILSTLSSDKQKSIEALDKIKTTEWTGTNLATAINRGVSALGSSDNKKIMILLADGDHNQFTSLDKAIEAAKGEVSIYTIGLGNDLNEDTLKNISEQTNGKYYFANSADDLLDEFTKIGLSVTIPKVDNEYIGEAMLVADSGFDESKQFKFQNAGYILKNFKELDNGICYGFSTLSLLNSKGIAPYSVIKRNFNIRGEIFPYKSFDTTISIDFVQKCIENIDESGNAKSQFSINDTNKLSDYFNGDGMESDWETLKAIAWWQANLTSFSTVFEGNRAVSIEMLKEMLKSGDYVVGWNKFGITGHAIVPKKLYRIPNTNDYYLVAYDCNYQGEGDLVVKIEEKALYINYIVEHEKNPLRWTKTYYEGFDTEIPRATWSWRNVINEYNDLKAWGYF